MPNSLRTKIKHMYHKCRIDEMEYHALIKKLDGHDKQIRADERAKTLDEFVNCLCQYNLGSIALTNEQNESIWRDIKEIAEQMQKRGINNGSGSAS